MAFSDSASEITPFNYKASKNNAISKNLSSLIIIFCNPFISSMLACVPLVKSTASTNRIGSVFSHNEYQCNIKICCSDEDLSKSFVSMYLRSDFSINTALLFGCKAQSYTEANTSILLKLSYNNIILSMHNIEISIEHHNTLTYSGKFA